MSRSVRIVFLSLIIQLCIGGEVAAQLNVYSRMTDPRAIARLDGLDGEPLRYVNRYGYPPERDSSDNNVILAQDSGAGVITHFWSTTTAADSTTNFKLYIDGELILSTTYYSFFEKVHGVVRPPFDSLYPGAQVCDVQIPYKKSFRITYIGEGWNIYYAIAWRPIRDSSAVQSFQLSQPYSTQYHQVDAEALYRQTVSPWSKEKALQLFDTAVLSPGSKITLFDMKGPAMIQKLHFAFPNYDFDELDSLWLNIYWDGSPYPAVHAPLADFFCSSNGGIGIHSFGIRTDSTGLSSFFPMPFATNAKIEIVSDAKRSLQIQTSLNYTLEPIDKNMYGYFHAYFSESNPTHYHIYHPVLSEHGRGRFAGFYLYAPHNPDGGILEGDPIFTIDSNARNNFRYTGGEDYYNSGWWFLGKMFSKPFAGHVNFLKSFYRFHILDAVDFKSSFNFDLQPGATTDLREDFRTVAYYYKHPTSFWVSRDTIKAGERWNVAGTGYKPNSAIVAKFDKKQTIFTTTSNAAGEFNAFLVVPISDIHGPRQLQVNDEVRPEPVYVLSNAAIRPIADSLPLSLRCHDTLLVTGTGFDPGEKIQIFLDSILISGTDTIVGGNDYRFYATVRMPNIADWKYHLRAVGDHYNEAMAADLITLTRIIPFEFENLIPWAVADTGYFYDKNLSTAWNEKWSQQAVAEFESKGTNQKVRFKFFMPVSDTFDVKLFLTNGSSYGRYSYAIDGKYFGVFKGYKILDPVWFTDAPSDTLSLGTVFFAKDTHMFVFTCLGKDSAATGYSLGADLLLLTPTTKMPLPKGVFTAHKNDSTLSAIDSPNIIDPYIILYPNPTGTGELTLGLDPLPGKIPDWTLDFVLSDILGRKLRSKYDVPIGAGGGLTHFDVHSLPTGNYLAEFIIHSGARDAAHFADGADSAIASGNSR